jgi:hypothetical protein
MLTNGETTDEQSVTGLDAVRLMLKIHPFQGENTDPANSISSLECQYIEKFRTKATLNR